MQTHSSSFSLLAIVNSLLSVSLFIASMIIPISENTERAINPQMPLVLFMRACAFLCFLVFIASLFLEFFSSKKLWDGEKNKKMMHLLFIVLSVLFVGVSLTAVVTYDYVEDAEDSHPGDRIDSKYALYFPYFYEVFETDEDNDTNVYWFEKGELFNTKYISLNNGNNATIEYNVEYLHSDPLTIYQLRQDRTLKDSAWDESIFNDLQWSEKDGIQYKICYYDSSYVILIQTKNEYYNFVLTKYDYDNSNQEKEEIVDTALAVYQLCKETK